MSEYKTWVYFRHKLTGEHVMTLSRVYEEYPDWERTTRGNYESWMSRKSDELTPATGDQQPTGDGAVDVMATFDELLTKLSGNLSASARQTLRTHFAAEHSMRTGAETEAEALREKLAAVTAALLECTTQMNNHGNDDNWETVTMAYAQAIKDGRAVLEASGGEGGQ